jgi:ornithine carbamoyltransferase
MTTALHVRHRMSPSLKQRQPDTFAAMSPSDQDSLVTSARALKRAALAGPAQLLLRGKNIGLLCEAEDSADAALFQSAATGLGAHVARIRPSQSGLLTSKDVQHTARMLGRLYDAIECQGLAAELVEQVRGDAGVPVFDGVGCAGHPSAALARLVDGDDNASPDNRRFLLQALLLSTIA